MGVTRWSCHQDRHCPGYRSNISMAWNLPSVYPHLTSSQIQTGFYSNSKNTTSQRHNPQQLSVLTMFRSAKVLLIFVTIALSTSVIASPTAVPNEELSEVPTYVHSIVSDLSSQEIARLDNIASSIKSSKEVDLEDPAVADLLYAIANQGYQPPSTSSESNEAFAKISANALPPGFYPPDGFRIGITRCETSNASPPFGSARDLVQYMKDNWSDHDCRQKNNHGSHCTNIGNGPEGSSVGVCGAVRRAKMPCRWIVECYERIINRCEKNGRIGGQTDFYLHGGYSPHNRVILH